MFLESTIFDGGCTRRIRVSAEEWERVETTYTEDIYKSDSNVEQYDDPDRDVYCVMEDAPSMSNEQCHVL